MMTDDERRRAYTVQELASDKNLWETYIDPADNAPFGDMTQEAREGMIREIWPELEDTDLSDAMPLESP